MVSRSNSFFNITGLKAAAFFGSFYSRPQALLTLGGKTSRDDSGA